MKGKCFSSHTLFILLSAVLLVAFLRARDASAEGGVCMEQAAIDAVSQCPGKGKGFSTMKKAASPESAFKSQDRKKSDIDLSQFQKGVTGPGVTGIQETATAQLRKKKKQKIADDLLNKELTLTKKLIKNMSNNDPKKPDAYFRIAELNFELQQNFGFKAMAMEDQLFQAKQGKDKKQFEQLKKKQKAYLAKSEEYRMAAIKAYAQLVSVFPDFARMDEALFYLGYSLDEIARTFPDKKQEYAAKARGDLQEADQGVPRQQVHSQRLPVLCRVLLYRGQHGQRAEVLQGGGQVRGHEHLRVRHLQAGMVHVQHAGLQGDDRDVHRGRGLRPAAPRGPQRRVAAEAGEDGNGHALRPDRDAGPCLGVFPEVRRRPSAEPDAAPGRELLRAGHVEGGHLHLSQAHGDRPGFRCDLRLAVLDHLCDELAEG
ncbi:MAG: hypothetical protein ABIJ56_23000 [Pseudomonadota bacterium]